MIVAIHQPNFIPYLGFFDKMKKSDLFIILDDVQVNDWVLRNKIRTPQGWTWISVPVESYMKKINETKILIDEKWIKKTSMKIEANYSDKKLGDNSPFKKWFLSMLYEAKSIGNFNARFIVGMSQIAGIDTEMIASSQLNVAGSGSDRVLNLCKAVGADTYLSGVGGKNYMKLDDFKRAGINVEFQDFDHPVYDQMFPGFEPNMSAIDKLFCTGALL